MARRSEPQQRPGSQERRHRRVGDAASEPEGPRRYYDPDFAAMAVKVLPGDHYVTDEPALMLVTVLGSCVAACIRDPIAGVGGMNHFMLPGEARPDWREANSSMRYGHFAMEQLINDILVRGGRSDRLEIKLFGGANVLQTTGLKIGSENIAFVRAYLHDENLRIAAEDLGGQHPRRVHYFPSTGRVLRLELKRDPDRAVFQRELTYREKLRQQSVEGSIELFD